MKKKKKRNYRKQPLKTHIKRFFRWLLFLISGVKNMVEMHRFHKMTRQKKRSQEVNIKGKPVKVCIYISDLAEKLPLAKGNGKLRKTKLHLWHLYYDGGVPAIQKYSKGIYKQALKYMKKQEKINKRKASK